LLVQELLLPRDIAAVAFGGDVLAEGGDGFPRDDFPADRGLDRDFEEASAFQQRGALMNAKLRGILLIRRPAVAPTA
jgi:hypothetical protein